MPEYIEREAAIKAVMAAKWESGSDGAMAMQIVASAPAADVGPVVHGRWIETSEGTFCSECNKNPIPVEHYNVCNFTGAYCPNCGAMMDGERRDGDDL